MDPKESRQWLDAEWESILAEDPSDPDPEIDIFVNSGIVSLRYAFVTQLLGKIADHSRSLLYLQSGSGEKGAWDARSFSKNVIVPWVADNHAVLGKSPDPYVNNPLRRDRLTHDMPDVKKKEEWYSLVTFFSGLDAREPEEIKNVFRHCLRSLARKLSEQKFEYPIPTRISMHNLIHVLESFLNEPSQGLRPLVVATALMRVLGKAFSLFSEVVSQGLNEADAARGMPGDVMCYGADDKILLVVEVKDRELTLADVRAAVGKVRTSEEELSNFLFAAPGVKKADQNSIESKTKDTWASGLNLHKVDIKMLVRASFVLLEEEWRAQLLKEIGSELNSRAEHGHREAWRSLLSDL